MSCSSDSDIIPRDNIEEELYADYSFSFDCNDFEQLLKDDDSAIVPVVAEYISGTIPKTKAGEIIPYQGTVTKLENQKTVWKYGVGENLVPYVFCGTSYSDMTISEIWRLSLTIDLTNENYAVRGFVGEWSGWEGSNRNNPQTRYQGNGGTADKPMFTTYIWRVVCDLMGKDYGYKRCYVPFDDQNKARIYVRIYY